MLRHEPDDAQGARNDSDSGPQTTAGVRAGDLLDPPRHRAPAFTDLSWRADAEAAARYRDLAEAIATVIWTTLPDGRLEDSPQWRELTGQTIAECRDWGWLDAVHPEDRAGVREAWRDAVETSTPYDVEYRVRHRDGAYLWFNSRGTPVRGGDGSVHAWAGICIDITARKRVEEALRESEERLRVAQELSLDAFTILSAVRDEGGRVVDFVWEFANPEAGRILRHPPEDLVGARLLEVLPGNAQGSDLFARYVRVVETGEPHDIELYYQGDGIRGWFRNMAVKLRDGVAISFSDITERKREAQYQALLAEAGALLNESLDLDDMLGGLVRLVTTTIADAAIAYVLEEEGRVRRAATAHVDPQMDLLLRDLDRVGPLHASDEPVRRVLADQEPVLFTGEEIEVFVTNPEHGRVVRAVAPRSLIVAPLVARGRSVGALAVITVEGGRPSFQTSDLAPVMEIARRAALAVENARLFEAAARAAARTARLQAVTAELTRVASPGEVAAIIVEQGAEAVGARTGCLVSIDADGTHLEMVHSLGLASPHREAVQRFPVAAPRPASESVRTGTAIFIDSADERRERYPALETLRSESGTGPICGVPVAIEDRIIGALSFGLPEGRRFAPEDRELLIALGRLCAQALERARLYEAERAARERAERRQKVAELAADRVVRLQRLGTALARALTPGEVADLIVRQGLEALGADAAFVVRPRDDETLETIRADGYPDEIVQAHATIPLFARIPAAEVVRTLEPVWVESRAERLAHFGDLGGASVGDHFPSGAVLPLTVKGRALGAIGFHFRHERTFRVEDRAFLVALAHQYAQALERARLYAAERAAARRTTLLAEAGVLLSSSLDVRAILESLARYAVETIADYCVAFLVDEDRGTLRRVAGAHTDQAGETLINELLHVSPPELTLDTMVGRVILTGRAELTTTIDLEDLVRWAAGDEEHLRICRILGPRSIIVAPLRTRGRTIGAFAVATVRGGRPSYDQDDVALVEELAARAALAADNARLFEQAQAANVTKGQFLATMSHELRTPLNAVIGYSDLLLEEITGPLTPVQRQHAGRIKASAWHQLDLIEEILSFSRIEAGREAVRPMAFDLRWTIQEVADLVRPPAEEKGVQLRIDLPEDALQIVSDAAKVRQVVLNMAGNAVKFTQEGEVALAAGRNGGDIVVRVSDTGPGIPRDKVDEIFEPFTQLDQSTTRLVGGTGLGLAICRRLAQLLGGDVTVESEPGVGSTFTLWLPDRAPDPSA